MKGVKIWLLLLFGFLLLFFSRAVYSYYVTPLKQFDREGFVADEVIVKFKPKVDRAAINRLTGDLKLRVFRQLRLPQTFVLKVPERQVENFAKTLSRLPQVEYAEPNYIAYALELTNDPGIVNYWQWGMFKVQGADTGESAWNFEKGDPSVKIAILDTGIDQNHEDLSAKIVANQNCTDSATVDDLYGHGTHVAGIAAALTNNGLGVAGLGYDSSLMNVKVLNDSGSGYYSWVADCIRWAADNGAKVINLSLGGSSASTTLENAVNYASGKGVVLSCAAGNSGRKSRTYPGYYTNCIAVAATDINDNKASFSTYDARWVDVAAPGVEIYSTMPNHSNAIGILNYGYLSGTSMSTPHVAGLAGLLFGVDPSFSNSTVRNLIEQNADQIPGTGSGWRSYWRWGRINALKSVKAALPAGPTPTPLPPTNTPIPTNTPTATPTPTTGPSPTATPTPTPTSTPTPTQTLTSTNTPMPTSTPTPTPTFGQLPTPTPTPIPWWCIIWPQFCR